MATAKKPSVADGAGNWWRLFHSLLLHSRDKAELERAKETWKWMFDHYITLKKIAIGARLDLLGAVWDLASKNEGLPSYELVLERVQTMEKNDELLDLLKKEYKEQANLHPHAPENLTSVLKECCEDWERLRIYHVLNTANRICQGSEEMGEGRQKRTWTGPRDSINYLIGQIEEGVFAQPSSALKPIDVAQDADTVADNFAEMMKQPKFETGIDGVYIQQNDFIGILGYLGHGKSTVSRFMLYNLALSGFNCLHISLENSQVSELNKYVLLHAHNPVFAGQFDRLDYKRLRRAALDGKITDDDIAGIREVADHMKNTMAAKGGHLTIQQPTVYSWETIRTAIEMQHQQHPLHVVLIDYLSMLDPVGRNYDDQRVKMTSMIKDIRNYGLAFDNGRGLCIISPVQANEDGKKKAEEHDGTYDSSAVNNDKELARSMTFILGAFSKGPCQEGFDLMLSAPKDREMLGLVATAVKMSTSGWIGSRGGSSRNVAPDPEKTLPQSFDEDSAKTQLSRPAATVESVEVPA